MTAGIRIPWAPARSISSRTIVSTRRTPDVGLDAPRALRDVRDAERDELLRLLRQRAHGERLAVEVEEAPVRLRHELAHPFELLLRVDAVKNHGVLLSGRFGSVYTSRVPVAARRAASL